jgi:hypothetical protein
MWMMMMMMMMMMTVMLVNRPAKVTGPANFSLHEMELGYRLGHCRTGFDGSLDKS